MNLIDNNYALDHDDKIILEDELVMALTPRRMGEWFALDELYAELGVKFTHSRTGTIDYIVDQSLSDWNWYMTHSGRGMFSYVRRNRQTDPKTFTLLNGERIVTMGTWPPFRPLEPTPEHEILLEATRVKLMQSSRSRKPTHTTA